jgi:hypothetical protein
VLELLITETHQSTMSFKRLEAFWLYGKEVCGFLRDSKDVLRVSGFLQTSLDAYLGGSFDDVIKDRLCDFLKFACGGNDKNRKLLASSKLIGVVLNECSQDIFSPGRRIRLCHVSVWNRDKLM